MRSNLCFLLHKAILDDQRNSLILLTMEGEVQEDWELVVLQRSGSTQSLEEETVDEDDTQGMMITLDYFNSNGVDTNDEDGSVQSGSPGWIEPRSDAPYGFKHVSELWSDSGSDNELGSEKTRRGEMGFDPEEREEEPSIVVGNGGEEKGFMLWWKIPIEVFKYCVFRVNPVWSLSMTAALVGFVVLGRRLYNMKKKNNKIRNLQLKLLLDDKKVANHAARFNEAAISLVKRVPIIRPALPSSMVGMNQWSMMSLR